MPLLFFARRLATALTFLCALGCPLASAATENPASPAPAPSPSPASGFAWRSLGPTVAGGRVSTVAGTDLDPQLFYVGTAGGGLWKSTNGGIDWHPAFPDAPSGSIGAIAISSVKADDVWVGTGEAWPRNDVIAGNGIFHTLDGGTTWKARGLERTSQIARILIDPHNSEHILVAALGDPFHATSDRGVFRSIDGGATWQKTLFLGTSSGASDIAQDPSNPDIVYAGMWEFHRNAWSLHSGGSNDGLYKSTDGGATWAKLNGNGLPDGMLGRIALAIAPSDSHRIYALIESKQGLLWRSDDGGAHWMLVSKNTLIDERPFYYSRIVVDPHDADHLFSVSVHLTESNDGGKAWHVSGKRVHGDHHDLWIAKDGVAILDGNDGGPALSHDNGKTWEWLNTLPTAQVYHVGYDRQKPYHVCAGLQDNGTWCAPNESGTGHGILQSDWTRVSGGDGTWVWPDPVDPKIVLAASGGGDNGGELQRFDGHTHTSTDISAYLRDQNVVAPSRLKYRFNWESPIAYSPFARDTVYFGGNVLFRSLDRGTSWTPISPDLTRNLRARQGLSGTPLTLDVTGAETFDTILDVAPSPIARGTIWVGTDDGLVQLTRDGGTHWRNVTPPGLDADARVATIEPSRQNSARAYATVDRHFAGDTSPYIFVTNDAGATWQPIVNGLPAHDFVRVVREDPHASAVLFAGTEDGVWWTTTSGRSWAPFPAKLPAVSVHDLRIQPDRDDLIAGTHGRGVWIFDDLRPLESHAAAATLFAPRAAQRYERETTTVNTRASGSGPAAAALLTFYQSNPAHTRPTIDIVDRFGHVVRHLAGTHTNGADLVPVVPNVAGYNRVPWDLSADAPTPWARAPKWNRGPDAGVPVLSGRYAVIVHRDGAVLRSTLAVSADRTVVGDARAERAGHAFLSGIMGELSSIDLALNVLDNVRLQLAAHADSTPAFAERIRAVAARAETVERGFTSQPNNSQDDDFLEDLLRERLTTFIGSSSAGRPSPERVREAAVLAADGRTALERYSRFMASDAMPLVHELARAGVTIDLAAKPGPDPKPGRDVDERGVRRGD